MQILFGRFLQCVEYFARVQYADGCTAIGKAGIVELLLVNFARHAAGEGETSGHCAGELAFGLLDNGLNGLEWLVGGLRFEDVFGKALDLFPCFVCGERE